MQEVIQVVAAVGVVNNSGCGLSSNLDANNEASGDGLGLTADLVSDVATEYADAVCSADLEFFRTLRQNISDG